MTDNKWEDNSPVNQIYQFITPKEIRQERIDICETCEYLNKAYFCKVCKCYMPAKTWVPNAICPMSKWNTVENHKKKEE